MNLELWLAFVATYTVISLIPGPSVLMVTGQALSHGGKAAFLCILGELVGGIVLVGLSFLGAGAILAASAFLFQIVKWAGVFYMAYLGYCQIVKARRDDVDGLQKVHAEVGAASAWAGFFTAILNPKAIIFYVAFLSQFLDPNANIFTQFFIVLITSTVIVGVVLSGYAILAVQARRTFQSARARRCFGYSGGGFLIGGSLFMATTR
ncbi:LysE family translocator [Amylibacter sp. SFDW26]|uniref:LysE family translocator n=1 Tax=Amylibacter sp. SFDW26 TaxID=2652722 RepID=UPI001262A9DA|nr:LysE family translocator [Amylibacter sp. SFDW26]KAB7615393.1 LysE family translocator [Amylibacter sp. SFDW26]